MRSRKIGSGVTFKNNHNVNKYTLETKTRKASNHNNGEYIRSLKAQSGILPKQTEEEYKIEMNKELANARASVAAGTLSQENYNSVTANMLRNWRKTMEKQQRLQKLQSNRIQKNIQQHLARRQQAQNNSAEFAKLIESINMNNITITENNNGNQQFKNKVRKAINAITNTTKKRAFNAQFDKFFTNHRSK
jgi:hypothetical protein